MKKLLLTLLVLGSFSSIAQDIQTQDFNMPSIRGLNGMRDVRGGSRILFSPKSDKSKLCQILTNSAGSIAILATTQKEVFGGGTNFQYEVGILKKDGEIKTLNMYSTGGTKFISNIRCTVSE